MDGQPAQSVAVPGPSLWARRRLHLFAWQALLLALSALALSAAQYVLPPTEEYRIAVNTLWSGLGAALAASLMLDYAASRSIFLDGTVAVASCAASFMALLLGFAAVHAFYSRLAFGAAALAWTLVQLLVVYGLARRMEVRLVVHDELARRMVESALRHRSEAMRGLRVSLLPGLKSGETMDGLVVGRWPEPGSAQEHALIALRLRGVRVYSAGFIHQLIAGRLALQESQHSLLDDAAKHPLYSLSKRALDIVAAALLGALSLPLLLLAVLAIRLDSPGSVMFAQPRLGLGVRRFTMYKLRTMVERHPDHGQATQDNDARITRVGRVLRRYRVDELPQLWNVLRGDMSLIGPRPEWERTAEQLRTQIPQFDLRSLVRPGITGWAQVHQGHVTSHDDVRTKLEFDLFYVRYMSLMLDLTIGWRTIVTVVRSFGAR